MNTNRQIFIIILLAGCLPQVASDIYAPSLPAIADSLDASVNLAQLSMVTFMFGIAIVQFIYGILSEVFGRRMPLMSGLIVMLIGTMVCLFSPNMKILILGRFIQGCGAGACTALWRSIFRDFFSGEKLAKYGGYLGIFITFIVPTAPVIGGYLQQYFGWRASFVFIAFYALIALFAVIFMLEETSQHHHKERLQLSFITKTFKQFLTNRIFMGYTLCTFLCYGAFFSWFIVGPVLLIDHMGLSPATFGWINFISGGLSMALAGFINGRMVERVGSTFMLRMG